MSSMVLKIANSQQTSSKRLEKPEMKFKEQEKADDRFIPKILNLLALYQIQLDHLITISPSNVVMIDVLQMLQIVYVLNQTRSQTINGISDLADQYLDLILKPLGQLIDFQSLFALGILLFLFSGQIIFLYFGAIKNQCYSIESAHYFIKQYVERKTFLSLLINYSIALLNKLLLNLLFLPLVAMMLHGLNEDINRDQNLNIVPVLIFMLNVFFFSTYSLLLYMTIEQKLVQGDINFDFRTFNNLGNKTYKLLLVISIVVFKQKSLEVQIYLIAISGLFQLNSIYTLLFLPCFQGQLRIYSNLVSHSILFNYLITYTVGVYLPDEQNVVPFIILIAPLLSWVLIRYKELRILSIVMRYPKINQQMQIEFLQTFQEIICTPQTNSFNCIIACKIITSHRAKCVDTACLCFGSKLGPKKTNITLKQIFASYVHQLGRCDQEKQTQIMIVILNFFYEAGLYIEGVNSLQQYLKKRKNLNFGFRHIKSKKILTSSIFDSVKLQYQIYQLNIKLAVNLNNIKMSQDNQLLTKSIEQFIKQETVGNKYVTQVLELLDYKISLLNFISSQQIQKQRDIRNLVKTISQKFLVYERELEKNFQENPCTKIRAILQFFYAEIQHDYIKAWDIIKFGNIEDDEIILVYTDLHLDKNDKDQTYLVVKIGADIKTLEIEAISSKSHQFFGYSRLEFDQFDQIEEFIPEYIQDQHLKLINNFIATGDSKYYRTLSNAFIRNRNHLLEQINLFIDIQALNLQSLKFNVFMKKVFTQDIFIFVDIQEFIRGCTVNFFQTLEARFGLKDIYLARFENKNFFDLFGIKLTELKNQSNSNSNQIYKGVSTLKIPQETTLTIMTFKQISYQPSMILEAELNITYNPAYQIYQVQVRDIKVPLTKQNTFTAQKQRSREATKSEDSSISSTPSAGVNVQLQEMRFQDIIFNRNFQKRETKLVSETIVGQAIRAHESYHVLPLNTSSVPVSPAVIRQLEKPLYSKDQIKEGEMNQEASFELDQSAHNPDLQNSSRNLFNNNQAKFIQLFSQMFGKRLNQQAPGQMDGLKSLSSSANGIRKSENYIKYDLIHRFARYKRIHIFNLLQIILNMGQISLSIIYASIIFSFIGKDSQRILVECDSLQVNRLFVEPIDQFDLTRYTIYSYQKAADLDQITPYQYRALVDFPYYSLEVSYQNILNRIDLGLQNANLLRFLQNKFSEVYMLKAQINSSSWDYTIMNLSLTEILTLQIQSENEFRLQFQQYSTTGGQSNNYFYYMTKNFFVLRHIFSQVAEEVQQNSEQQTEQLLQKWITLFLIFFSVTLPLFLLQVYMLCQYQNRIKIILGLFSKPQFLPITVETVEMLGFLKQIFQQDSQALFLYQFNLQIKEQQLKNIDRTLKSHKSHYEKVNKGQSWAFYNIRAFAFILIVFMVFLVFSFTAMIYMLEFITKFKNTIDFYKLMADTTVSVPSIYTQSEILYEWDRFPFLNQNDRQVFLTEVQKNIDLIQRFVSLTASFDTGRYLTSDKFDSIFQNAMSNNTCVFMDKVQINLRQDLAVRSMQTCHFAMGGLLEKGIIRTLNYMAQSKMNELGRNQFLTRDSIDILQLEGAYLMSDILDQIHALLRKSIEDQTNQSLVFVPIFCISLILVQVIFAYVSFYQIYDYFVTDFLLIRRAIMLLPSKTLYSDDVFERQVKFLKFHDFR